MPGQELRRDGRTGWVVLLVLGGVMVALVGWGGATFNRLVRLDQAVQAQWAQVENAYQRRADLVPNLVETVKGAAGFERQTLQAITEARANLQRPGPEAPTGAQLEQYQRQQEQLGTALSRLMVVVEAYPQLKATEAFRDLQAQLEGTENRIAVERMRFNEAAQAFNTSRDSFPTVLAVPLFGTRFAEKAYFHAREGANVAPPVRF
jgi:LemA protein